MPFAFIDDSGSGDAPYYVLAGYSATKETWFSFWDSWQAVLDLPPKIPSFKMSDAETLRGGFEGFSPEERTARLNRFIDVVLAHDLQEASIAFPRKLFEEGLYPELPGKHADPYYISAIAIITAFAGVNRFYGSGERMDFVFDRQTGMEEKVRRLFWGLKQDSPHRQLGGMVFRSDSDTLPLQAADLIAWQIRRFRCSTEPVRQELRRLHSSGRREFRKTISRTDIDNMVFALKQNLPQLRKDHGDDRVDRFVAGLHTRNLREGRRQPRVGAV
jgi:hypothetical protein